MPLPDPREVLGDAWEQAEGPRSLALVGIGSALLQLADTARALVDEARTQTLVAYLRALLAHPKPGVEELTQITTIAAVLERRLGLAPEEPR